MAVKLEVDENKFTVFKVAVELVPAAPPMLMPVEIPPAVILLIVLELTVQLVVPPVTVIPVIPALTIAEVVKFLMILLLKTFTGVVVLAVAVIPIMVPPLVVIASAPASPNWLLLMLRLLTLTVLLIPVNAPAVARDVNAFTWLLLILSVPAAELLNIAIVVGVPPAAIVPPVIMLLLILIVDPANKVVSPSLLMPWYSKAPEVNPAVMVIVLLVIAEVNVPLAGDVEYVLSIPLVFIPAPVKAALVRVLYVIFSPS